MFRKKSASNKIIGTHVSQHMYEQWRSQGTLVDTAIFAPAQPHGFKCFSSFSLMVVIWDV